MVPDIDGWEQMDVSEIRVRRLNVKEELTSMKGEKFIFPVAGGTVKLSGGDQDQRTPVLIRDSPDRGEEQENLRGESDGSCSVSRQDSSWYGGEVKGDFFGPSQEISFTVITWNVESNCMCRPKNHFLFHWKDYRQKLGCNVGKRYWRLLERWWRKRIVGCMDYFHKIHFIEWKSTRWIYMVKTDRQENKRSPVETLCDQRFGKICPRHRNVMRSKSNLSKSREDYVVFISLVSTITNSSVQWKILVESWKFRCQQQCFVDFNF